MDGQIDFRLLSMVFEHHLKSDVLLQKWSLVGHRYLNSFAPKENNSQFSRSGTCPHYDA